ncbi:MAG: hypothetical protein ABJB17_07940 [Burkholderiales bacterium]
MAFIMVSGSLQPNGLLLKAVRAQANTTFVAIKNISNRGMQSTRRKADGNSVFNQLSGHPWPTGDDEPVASRTGRAVDAVNSATPALARLRPA